jgi:hypothetical protein
MLSRSELFDGVHAFTPHQRTAYEVGLMATIGGIGLLSAVVIGVLSALLAQWLVDPGISTEGLISVIILPGVMAFIFVAASVKRISNPALSKTESMKKAGWYGMRAGFVVGLIVVVIIHFLGQLIMNRAIYGPMTTTSNLLSYCSGPLPFVYGFLFAIPIALGSGLYATLFEVGAQIVFEIVHTRLKEI